MNKLIEELSMSDAQETNNESQEARILEENKNIMTAAKMGDSAPLKLKSIDRKIDDHVKRVIKEKKNEKPTTPLSYAAVVGQRRVDDPANGCQQGTPRSS